MKDKTITGIDIRDGSIKVSDLAAPLPGIPGPKGAQGPAGPSGPAGPQGIQDAAGVDGTEGGPDAIRTWQVTFTANGSGGSGTGAEALVTSTETIPARTRLEGITGIVSGDFSNCRGAELSLEARDAVGRLAGVVGLSSRGEFTLPTDRLNWTGVTTGTQPAHLVVTGVCYVGPGVNDYLPMPSFTATFTFGTTDVSSVAGTPFS